MEDKNALFEMPETKVIFFDNEDVITTSSDPTFNNFSSEESLDYINDMEVESTFSSSGLVQLPAEDTGSDVPAHEDAPADEPVIDEPTYEDVPVEDSSSEDTVVDEPTVEEPSSHRSFPWAF